MNAKASDAWFTVDLRSTRMKSSRIRKTNQDDSDGKPRAGMTVNRSDLDSPAASIIGHRRSYLVRMAEAVHRAMGFDRHHEFGSNNSSVALRRDLFNLDRLGSVLRFTCRLRTAKSSRSTKDQEDFVVGGGAGGAGRNLGDRRCTLNRRSCQISFQSAFDDVRRSSAEALQVSFPASESTAFVSG